MLKKMLPYFAAAGHHHYPKSGYMYLQQMCNLNATHPDVYKAFSSGNHVVRRSDRYWAGLSTDLVIDQVLMRSVKSTGGLTRGRGMSESQRAHWLLLSMHVCSDFNNVMQEFTYKAFESSDQHKDSNKSRLARDNEDRSTFLQFLRERTPFTYEPTLRNIETGVVANEGVNVDQAKRIGNAVLELVEDQNALSFTFKKSNKAVTLGI